MEELVRWKEMDVSKNTTVNSPFYQRGVSPFLRGGDISKTTKKTFLPLVFK